MRRSSIAIAALLTGCVTPIQPKPMSHGHAHPTAPATSRLAPSDDDSSKGVVNERALVALFRHDTPLTGPLEHGTIAVDSWHLEREIISPTESRRQIALGQSTYTAWALLLNTIHRRVHPRFADEYLPSLKKLPAGSALQDPALRTEVELQIAQSSGEIETIGIRRTSGITEFDVAAMIAMSSAFPVEIPPELASSDGRMYLVWRLANDDQACSTIYAHPFRLQ